MTVYLEDKDLLEYVIAVLLRENGYVAGIPRRLLYGRSSGHQVPVIGIERSCSPFSYHNIILALAFHPDKSKQMETLYRLKGALNDLSHSLPAQIKALSELYKGSVGEYFHKIYGNSRYEEEGVSAQYKGIVFSTAKIDKNSWNYANSNGIFIVYFPKIIANKEITEWFSIIREELNVAVKDNIITIPSLKRHTRKLSDYRKLLLKIRKKNIELAPQEYHDLLTVIYSLLRKDSLRQFLNNLRAITLASLNNYPILIEIKNISSTALLEGCALFYLKSAKKQRSRSKSLTERLSFLGEIEDIYDDNLYRVTCQLNSFDYLEDSMKQMKLILYLDRKRIDAVKHSKSCLRLNLKEGLNLIAEISLLN